MVLFAFILTGTSKTEALAFEGTKETDPVYRSMTAKSESMSDYMISAHREYGHVYCADAKRDGVTRLLSIAAIYTTSGATLPNKFSVYLGKIELYGYSKTKKRWEILDSQPYPTDVALYELPWTNSRSYKCKNVTKTEKYKKIDLTAQDMKNRVLHFWGLPKKIDIKKDEYAYFACSNEFWVSTNAMDKMTATNGIDAKNDTNHIPIVQLYSSRGLTAKNWKRVHWGHTVPKDEYDKYDTSTLNDRYKYGKLPEPEPAPTTAQDTPQNDPAPDENADANKDEDEAAPADTAEETVDESRKTPKIASASSEKKGIRLKWKKQKKETDAF